MLNDFKNKITSQNGEDGVIEEILSRLNLTDIWCCEFGAWDGVHLSNTFNLVKTKNASVIMIEGDPNKFTDLLSTQLHHPTILALNYYVSHDINSEYCLDVILSKTSIPTDFDILSIDVDSYDLAIWESLRVYNPKLVIIEINNELPPGIIQRHSENMWLNSFTSTVDVGRQKGYTLVCHLSNLFFVRDDLINLINLDKKYIENPELLFDWKWVRRAERSKQKAIKRLSKSLKGGSNGNY